MPKIFLKFPPTIMRPISSAQRDNILSLASSGHSICKIATQLNIPKSTVGEYLQNLVPGRSTTKTGRPSKLSPTDKHAVVNQILTGKAENAAQVTKHHGMGVHGLEWSRANGGG